MITLEQVYGTQGEKEEKHTFKDWVKMDVDEVFFNLDEFAETMRIDGKNMLCVVQKPGVAERSAHWEAGSRQSYDEGMYKADKILYVKKADYGPMPKSDKIITVGKKDYFIKECTLKAGVYRMVLTVTR